ncbi:MAG: carbohydrate ABC transporter permease [Solobacterium sp.]|nr:carbohydrate ABC transporter permease [Solobacterium sp.]
MGNNKSLGLSDRTSDIILVLFTGLVMILVAYPLYYVLIASFSDPYAVYAGKTFLFPSGFTMKGYSAVFADKNIFTGYLNSIKYTIIGTIFSVSLLYITAYPLSRKDLPGRRLLNIFFIITMYFGGGLIPTYLVVKSTGLINNIWALFLPGGVAVGNMIIVRNYFQNSIPKELIEASEIDGCSHLRTFKEVIIPLSMPIMAVMVVFSMVAYWNDWFTALIYLTGAEKAPLPLVLRNILIKSSASAAQSSTISGGYAELNKITEMIKFASIIVAAAPMLIFYPFVQKYFEQGMMAGAVKG